MEATEEFFLGVDAVVPGDDWLVPVVRGDDWVVPRVVGDVWLVPVVGCDVWLVVPVAPCVDWFVTVVGQVVRVHGRLVAVAGG